LYPRIDSEVIPPPPIPAIDLTGDAAAPARAAAVATPLNELARLSEEGGAGGGAWDDVDGESGEEEEEEEERSVEEEERSVEEEERSVEEEERSVEEEERSVEEEERSGEEEERSGEEEDERSTLVCCVGTTVESLSEAAVVPARTADPGPEVVVGCDWRIWASERMKWEWRCAHWIAWESSVS